jgi:hypothetical protein
MFTVSVGCKTGTLKRIKKRAGKEYDYPVR